MAHFIIGLDFGTTNTKACIQHKDSNPVKHEFMVWPGQDEPFLFPSVVHWMPDDTFQYGKPIGRENSQMEYGLFKMAVAEDEEFHYASGLANTRLYELNQYKPFTPELLSIFFITHALLQIEEKFTSTKSSDQSFLGKLGGLLGRARKREVRPHSFSVNLGIPTQYSQTTHFVRRRKFETVLVLANELVKEYTLETYKNEKASVLIEKVRGYWGTLNNLQILRKLAEENLKVIPESFAGLYSLIQARQLEPGCYATLDIGGGSTDVAFFRYNNRPGRPKIQYYASESIMLGTSYLYHILAGEEIINYGIIKEIEHKVRKLGNSLLNEPWYRKGFRAFFSVTPPKEVGSNVRDQVMWLFESMVYGQFINNGGALADQNFGSSFCLLFGGGSFLPWPEELNAITIHNNGYQHNTDRPIRHIMQYAPIANILPEIGWNEIYPILTIAYGLSFEAGEFNDNQNNGNGYFWPNPQLPDNGRGGQGNLIPHPANQDCYVYDVIINRTWIPRN